MADQDVRRQLDSRLIRQVAALGNGLREPVLCGVLLLDLIPRAVREHIQLLDPGIAQARQGARQLKVAAVDEECDRHGRDTWGCEAHRDA